MCRARCSLGSRLTRFARATAARASASRRCARSWSCTAARARSNPPPVPLVRAGLYGLSGPGGVAELGFDDLPEGAVVVLEWPARADGLLPPDRLAVSLTLAPKLRLEFRRARITGFGALAPRVDRMAAVRQFIAESGYSEALRSPLRGDASTRSYQRLAPRRQPLLPVNSPRPPCRPPAR